MTVFEIMDLDLFYLFGFGNLMPVVQTAYREKQQCGQRMMRGINIKYNFNNKQN